MAEPTILSPGSDEDLVTEGQLSTDALAILNRSEIEVACEIAKKNPRSYEKFRQDLEQFTCTTQAVAATMFYAKPVAGGSVIGPGIRFAEVLKTAWRNTRTGVRIIGERGDVAVAQGIFFDAETNTGISVDAQRSILTKERKKFSQDMIVTTGNAAASVAYRNAIFRGVPRGLWDDLYEKTRVVAVGKVESFARQVNEAVEQFSKQGVTLVMLLNSLGAPSIRDITPDNILKMRAIFASIRNGELSIEDAFGSPDDKEIEEIMEALGWNGAKKNMSRQNFKGKRSEHLDMLRGEMAKRNRVTGKPAVEAKAQTATEATAEADTKTTEKTGSSETSVPETVAKTEDKPAAKPAANPATDDNW